MAKKKAAKQASKKRAAAYEPKLAINGTFEDVIRASVKAVSKKFSFDWLAHMAFDTKPRLDNEPPLVQLIFNDIARAEETLLYMRQCDEIKLNITRLGTISCRVNFICDGSDNGYLFELKDHPDLVRFVEAIPTDSRIEVTTSVYFNGVYNDAAESILLDGYSLV